jgi:hypothetical protein
MAEGSARLGSQPPMRRAVDSASWAQALRRYANLSRCPPMVDGVFGTQPKARHVAAGGAVRSAVGGADPVRKHRSAAHAHPAPLTGSGVLAGTCWIRAPGRGRPALRHGRRSAGRPSSDRQAEALSLGGQRPAQRRDHDCRREAS